MKWQSSNGQVRNLVNRASRYRLTVCLVEDGTFSSNTVRIKEFDGGRALQGMRRMRQAKDEPSQ